MNHTKTCKQRQWAWLMVNHNTPSQLRITQHLTTIHQSQITRLPHRLTLSRVCSCSCFQSRRLATQRLGQSMPNFRTANKCSQESLQRETTRLIVHKDITCEHMNIVVPSDQSNTDRVPEALEWCRLGGGFTKRCNRLITAIGNHGIGVLDKSMGSWVVAGEKIEVQKRSDFKVNPGERLDEVAGPDRFVAALFNEDGNTEQDAVVERRPGEERRVSGED